MLSNCSRMESRCQILQKSYPGKICLAGRARRPALIGCGQACIPAHFNPFMRWINMLNQMKRLWLDGDFSRPKFVWHSRTWPTNLVGTRVANLQLERAPWLVESFSRPTKLAAHASKPNPRPCQQFGWTSILCGLPSQMLG